MQDENNTEWHETQGNRDTGSLRTGNVRPDVGDVVEIRQGGTLDRKRITYVMGSPGNWHVCAKGGGAFPVGNVEWRIINADKSAPDNGPCLMKNKVAVPKPFTSSSEQISVVRQHTPIVCGQRPEPAAATESARPAERVRIPSEIVVAGCDVSVSEQDRNTGFVVIKCSTDGSVEVIYQQQCTPAEIERELCKLLEEHHVSYLVLDAPLLPDVQDEPPFGNNGDDETVSCYRPHEGAIGPGSLSAIRYGAPADIADAWYTLLNRMPAMSTWRKTDGLSPFAENGNKIKALASNLLPFITDLGCIADRGILEGFPKATFLPLIPACEELLQFSDTVAYPRGQVDAAILRWLLDPKHPDRFWDKAGLTIVSGSNASLAMKNKDVVCGFSMALQGLLYALGKASVICSSQKDGSFDFGHILMPSSSLFEPWARDWFDGRLSAVRRKFINAEISWHDITRPC